MAIIDRLRIRDIFTGAGWSEGSARAVADALDDEMKDVATTDNLRSLALEFERMFAQLESRFARMLVAVVGIMVALHGITVGIIIAVLG